MIMGFNPFSKKSWDKAVNDTKKAVVDPVVDAGKQAADAAAKVAADAQRLAEQQAAEAKRSPTLLLKQLLTPPQRRQK